MITLIPNEADRVLVVELSGMVSEADFDQGGEQLARDFPEFSVRVRGGSRGGIGLLLDYRNLDGWEKGAKTLGTISGKLISDAVRRVALVADDRWRDELPRLTDIVKTAEVRMFAPDQRAAAEAWLAKR
ncbi:MAG: STAS/SEC14 domain-containing protein [Rhodospirillales bacterium]